MRAVCAFIGTFVCVVYFASLASAASVCKKDLCINVDLALTTQERSKGLQGRDGLEPGQGMLFIFEQEAEHNFWMKDMKFPIDIIWIDSQRRIVTIAASRPACVKDPCPVYQSSQKARYVLEVPDNYALENNLKEGDLLEFKGIQVYN